MRGGKRGKVEERKRLCTVVPGGLRKKGHQRPWVLEGGREDNRGERGNCLHLEKRIFEGQWDRTSVSPTCKEKGCGGEYWFEIPYRKGEIWGKRWPFHLGRRRRSGRISVFKKGPFPLERGKEKKNEIWGKR